MRRRRKRVRVRRQGHAVTDSVPAMSPPLVRTDRSPTQQQQAARVKHRRRVRVRRDCDEERLRQVLQGFAEGDVTRPMSSSRSQPRDGSDIEGAAFSPSPVRVKVRRRVRVRRLEASARSRSRSRSWAQSCSPPGELAQREECRSHRVRVGIDTATGDRIPAVSSRRHADVEPTQPDFDMIDLGAADVASLPQTVYEWLNGLDNGGGALLQYYEVIKREFADFTELATMRIPGACGPSALSAIEPSFWQICGVRQTGHRLLLARGLTALFDA